MTGHGGIWIVAGLEVVAALGIAAFWTIWLRVPHDEEWLPEGYIQHERAFLIADGALGVLLVAAAVLLVAHPPLGWALSLVCAGMLAFLGLLDAAYFWQTGLFAPNHGGVANAAVVLAVLGLAAVLVAAFFSRGG